MRFAITEHVPFPREAVFRMQRDGLPDGALPSVAGVELLAREEAGTRVRTVKRWTGRADVLPEAVRAVVPPRILQWRDDATWDEARWAVDWAIELEGLPGALVARGRNRFDADGDETVVQLAGELALVPARLGAAGVLAPLLPTIERFLVDRIRVDLRRGLDAVAAALAEAS